MKPTKTKTREIYSKGFTIWQNAVSLSFSARYEDGKGNIKHINRATFDEVGDFVYKTAPNKADALSICHKMCYSFGRFFEVEDILK